MQLIPWGSIREVAERVFIKADRAVRRGGGAAAVGGIARAENQASGDRGDRDGALAKKRAPGQDDDARVECDKDPAENSVQEQLAMFTLLKIATVLSALYMGGAPWVGTLFNGAREGFMCTHPVVCAPSPIERILLTGSKFTAGLVYPSLVATIFSKCYATRSFLHHSWYGAVIDCEPSHDMHTYFGYLTLVAGLVHGVLHAARYIYADTSGMMYNTDAGRSGLIACFLLLPIVLPMRFEVFRTKMSFQVRKNLHMLFLPMLVALCFHSDVFGFVGTILIVWYTLDRVYFTSKQTFFIDHPIFQAVGRGTMVTFDLPTGYTFKAGSYVYVNSPMISRSEWHPFSIIQVPGSPPRATFYAEAVGDWTKELFRLGLEKPRLPLWITAAQPSLMEKSIYYDNVVLVCTGAGITPAVSIIERYTKKKNIHLLWMSRDGGMVALFEKQLRQVHSTVHLTGSPTEDTKVALQSLLQPSEIDDLEANPGMSFRSSAIPMSTQAVDGTIERTGAGKAFFGNLDSPSPGNLRLSLFRRQSDLSWRRQGSNADFAKASTKPEARPRPGDPVKLLFGRPDIGAYLTEILAAQIEARDTLDEGGLDTSRPSLTRASGSLMDIERGAGLSGRQESKRLDSAQKISKEKLLKADQTVLAPCQGQEGSANGKGHSSSTPTACPDACRQLRWLVLYCGANPKVEEAIAKTCDELHVSWQKEYFGAW